MNTITKIVVDNLYYIAENKNLNIHDIEKAMGRARGVLSRIKKGGCKSELTIDNVVNVSEFLNVDIGTLISNDFRKDVIRQKIKELEEELESL